jgi:UPF0716 protein FxsA
MWVLMAILAVPVIEIALFVTVGAWLGLWLTLLIVFGTALLGVQIIRREGIGSVRAFQAAGPASDPLSPLAHRAMLVVAGGLLILPGFLTDTLGLLLLIPALRQAILRQAGRYIRVDGFVATGTRRSSQDDWIDAEYEEIVPDRDKLGGGSKWTRH